MGRKAITEDTSTGAGVRYTNAYRSLPFVFAVGFFALYVTYSLSLHYTYRTTGFDLGIFEQIVRSYAAGQLPESSLKGPDFPIMGDHFSPILATLAPLYALWPSPNSLLTAQAALLAASIWPVTRVAIDRFGPWLGAAISIAYGTSWGLQSALAFDFHEACFAVPLMAWVCHDLHYRRFGRAACAALPLILVKEDLGITVAAVGVYIFLHGRRRLGAALCATGAGAAIAVLFVVIPAFNPGGENTYLGYIDGDGGGLLTRLLLPWREKFTTLAWLVAPTAFLCLRSPIVLLAAPTIAWRFWADNPSYWGTQYHYSAILIPIMFVAAIDAACRLRLSAWPHPRFAIPAMLAITSIVLLISTPLPLGRVAQRATWTKQFTPAETALLELIPDGASVAADNNLASHLTNRADVYLWPSYPNPAFTPQWVIALDPPQEGIAPASQQAEALSRLPVAGYELHKNRGRVMLWRHKYMPSPAPASTVASGSPGT